MFILAYGHEAKCIDCISLQLQICELIIIKRWYNAPPLKTRYPKVAKRIFLIFVTHFRPIYIPMYIYLRCVEMLS